jgi:MYXO-CTERM domain-containing protein
MKLTPILLALSLPSLAAPANAAVTFPPDASYLPLHCNRPNGAVMTDLTADQPGFLDDTDVIGTATTPAGWTAADATNLYLRIRVNGDPAPGGVLHASSWGIEYDLDGDLTTYELLILVDGSGPNAVVELFKNTATSIANGPNDPADLPAVASVPFAGNARSIAAADAAPPEFFLDFALPWSTLEPAGLHPNTPTHVWVGSSSASNTLNGDLACHDGASGAPKSDVIVSTATTADPTMDPGTGGAAQLTGTEGCSTTRGGGWGAIVLALGLVVRRRSHRRAHGRALGRRLE